MREVLQWQGIEDVHMWTCLHPIIHICTDTYELKFETSALAWCNLDPRAAPGACVQSVPLAVGTSRGCRARTMAYMLGKSLWSKGAAAGGAGLQRMLVVLVEHDCIEGLNGLGRGRQGPNKLWRGWRCAWSSLPCWLLALLGSTTLCAQLLIRKEHVMSYAGRSMYIATVKGLSKHCLV